MNRPYQLVVLATALVAAGLMLSPPAAADDPALQPQVRVIETDSIAGVGLVTGIYNLAVNNAGEVLVEADTDNPSTDYDYVLLRNGPNLQLQEGQSLPLPPGATLDTFDTVNLNNNGNSGWNFFLGNTVSTSDDSGIYMNTNLIIQEGAFSTSPAFSAGTPYIGFFECKINDQDQILILASIDDPAIASSVDRALVVVDPYTMVETVVFKEGDAAPGTTETFTDFDTGPHNFDFNNKGDVMFTGDLTGLSTANAAIYINSTMIAREGDPAPIPGRNWYSVDSSELSLNNHGDYVFHARLDGATTDDYIIIQNGAKFVQEGDTLPDIAPFRFTAFGSGPVLISDFGDVLWYGDWDDPNTNVDTGVFLNEKLIMQEGVTLVNGIAVDTISGVQDGMAMSDDGRFILVDVTLTGAVDAAVFYDRGPFDTLGGELAGSNGTPLLRGFGPLTPNTPISVDLSRAKPASLAHLIVGLSAVNLPFLGTTLVPNANVIAFNLPTGPYGDLRVTTNFPPGVPSGVGFWLQYFIVDGTAPFGYSASNAVKGTTP